MSVEKYGWTIQKKKLQDSTFSQHRENWKIFNIISKYFSFFNNKPPTSWVPHITRDFLTCYSCSYYSSMLKVNNFKTERYSRKSIVNKCILDWNNHQKILKQNLQMMKRSNLKTNIKSFFLKQYHDKKD